MTFGTVRARLVGAVLVTALIAGCASRERAVDLESLEARDIFQMGEEALEARPRQPDASRYFSEVERLYPYSEWARGAIVMQAFAEHKRKNYEEARATAQRYLDLYPAKRTRPGRSTSLRFPITTRSTRSGAIRG
jgi:outer membrane protein assembly factor BamD